MVDRIILLVLGLILGSIWGVIIAKVQFKNKKR